MRSLLETVCFCKLAAVPSHTAFVLLTSPILDRMSERREQTFLEAVPSRSMRLYRNYLIARERSESSRVCVRMYAKASGPGLIMINCNRP